MEKIAIIGNGFDLAHGLKTAYFDFIQNYFREIIISLSTNGYYDDILISCKTRFGNNTRHILNSRKGYVQWVLSYREQFNFKSEFLEAIIQDLTYGWVDIENIYFSELLRSVQDLELVSKLNNEFEYLRERLIEYLIGEQDTTAVKTNETYISLLTHDLTYGEKLKIINFNYTDTAEKYSIECEKLLQERYDKSKKNDNKTSYVELINIHGKLKCQKEEPIFGIGDEYHKEYNELREQDCIQEILKFSKSFWYQRTNNYRKIMEYIGSVSRTFGNMKNVEIYGHSCGLSDRTLLRNIFEHENINDIKLFYYPDKDGFIKQSYDVWRHFNDSHQYRLKLVPFELSKKMPQIERN